MLGIHQTFDGIQGLIFDALSLGADTFQFFVRNNRNLKMRQFHVMDFKYFNEALENSGITTYVLHASYAMNPASIDEDKRQNAARIIKEDLSVLAGMNGNTSIIDTVSTYWNKYQTKLFWPGIWFPIHDEQNFKWLREHTEGIFEVPKRDKKKDLFVQRYKHNK